MHVSHPLATTAIALTIAALSAPASAQAAPGDEYVALGERLAEDGVLTPRVLGDAARSGRHDAQDLKRVWHLVARFGLTPPG